MEPKLSRFYFDSLLPEIIDPRTPRYMDIREPPYVIEAQEKLKQKKLDKKKLPKIVNQRNLQN